MVIISGVTLLKFADAKNLEHWMLGSIIVNLNTRCSFAK